MIELETEETKKLWDILKANEHISSGNPNLRTYLLKNCGVEKICYKIKLDDQTNSFVLCLCTELENPEFKIKGKPAFIVFWENYKILFPDTLYEQQTAFINSIIARWESSRNHKPKPVQKKEEKTGHIKFDKKIISDFDQDDLAAAFKNGFQGARGAFGFSMGSMDSRILETYFFHRFISEYKIRRKDEEYRQCRLFVNPSDIKKDAPVLLAKLENDIDCRIEDWFENKYSHDLIILIRKNFKITNNDMEPMVINFWNHVINISGNLRNQCFVALWLNGTDPAFDLGLERFTALPIKDPVDTKWLNDWFSGKLHKMEIKKEVIEQKLELLKDYQGDVHLTYLQMETIIKQLQGGLEHND
ncbi:Uncharacterized protein dnl_52470 [Desulfonema limicola]|uniref:Uncharacterized protein n=1 Tax=Desulfonema limicola TaxID=45656 RepID=A0A975BCJ4_9BACT|nr:hypothetical protein [Desulfonema limicola]QTA82862.1 Uncharacterized protein dnl_52470 [Desulfonema limicola]